MTAPLDPQQPPPEGAPDTALSDAAPANGAAPSTDPVADQTFTSTGGTKLKSQEFWKFVRQNRARTPTEGAPDTPSWSDAAPTNDPSPANRSPTASRGLPLPDDPNALLDEAMQMAAESQRQRLERTGESEPDAPSPSPGASERADAARPGALTITPAPGDAPVIEHAVALGRCGLCVTFVHVPLFGRSRAPTREHSKATGCSCGKQDCNRGKHPIGSGWQKRATDNETDLRDQYSALRIDEPNVGIVLGTQPGGHYVISIDVDDPARLQQLTTELGPLPATPACESARGPKLFFTLPPDTPLDRLKNITGLGDKPGIDVKIENGQVVVAPSMHASGTRYAWSQTGPVAELPAAWVLALLVPPPKPKTTYKPGAMPSGARDQKRARAYLEKAVTAEASLLARVVEGGRNTAFYTSLCRMLPLAHDRNMPAGSHDYVVQELSAAARAAGLGEREIAVTVRSAEGKVGDQVRDMPPPREPPPANGVSAQGGPAATARSTSAGDADNPWGIANAIDVREVLAWLEHLPNGNAQCPHCRETEHVGSSERGLQCPRCPNKGRDGIQSNLDLVMHVRGVGVKRAYKMIAEKFGLEALRSRSGPSGVDVSHEGHGAEAADSDGRPVIYVSPDVHVTVEESVAALCDDDNLYVRAGKLAHVIPISFEEAASGDGLTAGTPIIRDMPSEIVQVRLSRRARFMKLKDGAWQQCMPPEHLARKIHALGQWEGIPPILGIVESPIMLRDGPVLQTPGYHAPTGLLYVPSCTFPPVPEAPTIDDARAAFGRLAHLYIDFPFASDAHRLVPVANTITILCRHAIPGHVPGCLYDAPTPGSGKSLITDSISILCSGRECPRSTYPVERGETNDTEMVKLLTGYAAMGSAYFSFDNILPNTPIGGGSLDKAMTSRWVQFRQLGQSRRNETYRWVAVVMATGNNPTFSDDGAARRWLQGRLVPKEEMPDQRDPSKFTVQPDLLTYVHANRAQLVVDALTIPRAFHVAGRPKQKVMHWGSFDSWVSLVAASLAWCTGIDVSQARVAQGASPQTGALTRFVHSFREAFGSKEPLAREIVELTYSGAFHKEEPFVRLCSAMEELSPPPRGGNQTDARRLGKQLERYKERVVEGGLRLLVRYDDHLKAQRYRVESV